MLKYWGSLLLAGCVLSVAWAEEKAPLTGAEQLFRAAEAGEKLPEGITIGNYADQARFDAARKQKEGREAAIAFLRAKGTEQMLDSTFRRLFEEQCKAVPEMAVYRETIFEFYREALGFEALKVEIADLYLKHFTIEELKSLTAFYQSDLGKKYAAAEVSLSPELSLLFLKRQQEKMPELEKKLQAMSK